MKINFKKKNNNRLRFSTKTRSGTVTKKTKKFSAFEVINARRNKDRRFYTHINDRISNAAYELLGIISAKIRSFGKIKISVNDAHKN